MLPAGDYTVAIMQYANLATRPNFANGLDQRGNPTFSAAFGCSNGQFCDDHGFDRTNFWAFDILNVEQAVIPEPSTLALLGIGLATLRRRCRPIQERT